MRLRCITPLWQLLIKNIKHLLVCCLLAQWSFLTLLSQQLFRLRCIVKGWGRVVNNGYYYSPFAKVFVGTFNEVVSLLSRFRYLSNYATYSPCTHPNLFFLRTYQGLVNRLPKDYIAFYNGLCYLCRSCPAVPYLFRRCM